MVIKSDDYFTSVPKVKCISMKTQIRITAISRGLANSQPLRIILPKYSNFSWRVYV